MTNSAGKKLLPRQESGSKKLNCKIPVDENFNLYDFLKISKEIVETFLSSEKVDWKKNLAVKFP